MFEYTDNIIMTIIDGKTKKQHHYLLVEVKKW